MRPILSLPLKYLLLRSLGWPIGPGMDLMPRILGYHSVGDGENAVSTSLQRFQQQIDWLLRRGYRILTLRSWWDAICSEQPVPARCVVLTFDDGFRGVYRHAAPWLLQRGIAATVFLITDCVGGTNAYDRPLGTLELPLMNWDEIESLKRKGWDFQSHGMRHRVLCQLPAETLEEEVWESKAILEKRLGERVDFFCYPYGAFDAAAVKAVERAGYAGAVSCWAGTLPGGRPVDAYRLRRIMVEQWGSLDDFTFRFSLAYRRLAELRFLWRRMRGREEEFSWKR